MSPFRLRIFIDGGYLFHTFASYREHGYKFSCKRLVRKMSENHNLIKVHYFDAINMRNPETKRKQETFYYGYLRDKLGWEPTITPLQWPGGEAKQKGVDSGLTLQLHDLAVKNEYDIAIILAADFDFVPSVERAKEHGKVIRNAYFSIQPSFHLQQACNGQPIRLDDIDFVYPANDPRALCTISSLGLKVKKKHRLKQ